MEFLSVFLRMILGLVLLTASIGKLCNMEAFELALEQYRLPYVGLLKYIVILIELATGLGLVIDKGVIISSLASLLLFSALLVLYTTMYNKSLDWGCGCFGNSKAVIINKYGIGKIVSLMILSAAVSAFHLIHCLL